MADDAGSVSPPTAAALATTGFAALAIAAFGVTSTLFDVEVIATPGLGNLPGAAGMALSVLAVGVTAWAGLRRPQPSYAVAVAAAVAAVLAYLVGVLIGAVVAGVDPVRAVAAVGGFVTSWFAVLLAAIAAIAGWVGVALVRTRAHRPRWPWERDDPDADE
ncbi:hypothetical protein [Microbacterium sp.]|uniref:hypothetical protein n=1 Tax=Microbacterium sp. TaxID=51671 RepID=UPI003A8A9526